jgi:hypothetical protein
MPLSPAETKSDDSAPVAAVEEAIAEFGGDARAAVGALPICNVYLEAAR